MQRNVLLVLVCAMLSATGLCAMDRGLGNPGSVYIPRGTVAASLSCGFDNWKATGEESSKGIILAGLVDEVNGNLSLIDVSAGLSWFFRDNLSFGVRFGYGNTSLDLNHAELLNILKLENKHIRRETYAGALALRGYMPLFDSKVVALFCESRLTGSFGYGKNYAETDRGKEGRYSDLWSASLGLYPGISVFASNRVAFEVSLPLVEGGIKWDKQIKGQAHDSALSRRFVNFKPGLLGLSFGIVYHF